MKSSKENKSQSCFCQSRLVNLTILFIKGIFLKDWLSILKGIFEEKDIDDIKEYLNITKLNMVKVVESYYDREVYNKAKNSIDKFEQEILEFIEIDFKSLGQIQSEFESNIRDINDLNIEDQNKIINFGLKCIQNIKNYKPKDNLKEKIRLSSALDITTNFDVLTLKKETRKYIDTINHKIIVEPTVYNDFLKKIKEKRILIIEGRAGIGKTILSEWLLKKFYDEDSNLVILETNFENINETIKSMREIINKNTNVVIYLNDIFGSNILKVSNHQALGVLKKIDNLIKTYSNLYILVNSRDNINKILKDKLSKEEFNVFERYINKISIESYSSDEKLQLISNSNKQLSDYLNKHKSSFLPHLWSKLNIIYDKFNPRIISLVLNNIEKNKSAEEVIYILAENLKNPFAFYKEELEKLTEDAKVLLFNLFYLIPYKHFMAIEEDKYLKSLSNIKLSKDISEILFELEQWIESPSKIVFKDPSIIDFLDNYLSNPSVNSKRAIFKIEKDFYYFRQIYNMKKDEQIVKLLFENRFEDDADFLGNKLYYILKNNEDVPKTLLKEYMNTFNTHYYIFETQKNSSSPTANILTLNEILKDVLCSSNKEEIFEYIFFEDRIDWKNRIEDFYEFEEITQEFESYVENNIDTPCVEFIASHEKEISYFLDSYVKSVQNQIDEEYYSYIPLYGEALDEFKDCLDYENQVFKKKKFKDNMFKLIHETIKKELLDGTDPRK